jgi:hypothetical protein
LNLEHDSFVLFFEPIGFFVIRVNAVYGLERCTEMGLGDPYFCPFAIPAVQSHLDSDAWIEFTAPALVLFSKRSALSE